jgi:hypothetical protein
VSIEDELKKEIALLTRENQQLTHQLFDYRAAFIRARDREWVGLDPETMRNTTLEFNRGALWAERYLKEKNT